VHISAASLWVGALATMAALLWFGAPQLRREAFVRFSRLAPVLIGLVLAAGIYLSLVRLPHLHDLWTERYGQVLLVKIGLVCFALAWGGFHHFVVRPALDRADTGFLGRIGKSLVGESLVGISVLLLAAVLVDSRPPAKPIQNQDQAALTGGSAATLTP
jgi:putative copper export protein